MKCARFSSMQVAEFLPPDAKHLLHCKTSLSPRNLRELPPSPWPQRVVQYFVPSYCCQRQKYPLDKASYWHITRRVINITVGRILSPLNGCVILRTFYTRAIGPCDWKPGSPFASQVRGRGEGGGNNHPSKSTYLTFTALFTAYHPLKL